MIYPGYEEKINKGGDLAEVMHLFRKGLEKHYLVSDLSREVKNRLWNLSFSVSSPLSEVEDIYYRSSQLVKFALEEKCSCKGLK